MKKIVVSVSGGAGSTLAAHRAVEKYGLDAVTLLFADTGSEHPDLYELLKHMDVALKPVIKVGDGLGIWDAFMKHGIIRTPTGACKASLELKHKPIAAYMKNNFTPDAIVASGLEYTEPERRERFDKKWAPFECWHPLTDHPYLSDCQIIDTVVKLGYPKQSLYERRYPHNNCGGGCVLAGLGQWHALWMDDRDQFNFHKEKEREFNELNRKDKKPFTILRDQRSKPTERDGEMVMERRVEPLTLEEFEKRILANDINLQDFRTACGCFLGEQGNLFGDSEIRRAA